MSNIFNSAIADLVTPQKRSGSVGSSLASFFNFNLTEGAKKVNTHSSLTLSPYFCAINAIANSIALLPMSVFLEEGKSKSLKKDHPVHYLVYREPNNYMTAFTFKFIMAKAIFEYGNAYALILRDGLGNVAKLIYLNPAEVDVIENNRNLYYKFKGEIYTAYEILHVPGFSFDGVTGKSIIHYAADNLGVSLAAQNFASSSLNDRGLGLGVIESEKDVVKKKKEEIADAVAGRFSAGNKFRVAMLDEGMKYKSIALTPAEAQFVETYMSGIGDIARWFNIPLHKLHVSGEGGYNFLVQMSLEYLQTAVMPLAEKFKQEFERKLFTSTERRKGIHLNLNYKKLLQADPKARAQYYKDLYYLGAINANEIRQLEDMNPREDEYGDDYVQMSNVINEKLLEKQLNEATKSQGNE